MYEIIITGFIMLGTGWIIGYQFAKVKYKKQT